MYSIGEFIGALTLTYVVTRLSYFIHSKFFQKVEKLNAMTFIYITFLLLWTILGGYGFGQGGEPVFLQAFLKYLPAAVIFLIFDLYKLKSSKQSEEITPLATVEIKMPSDSKISEKNFCSNCGGKLEGSAKFCSNCGAAA